MKPLSDQMALRIGSTAAGLLAGLAVGLVSAIAALAICKANASFPRFVFGGAAAGALVGLVMPGAARNVAEGMTHFLIGFFAGGAGHGSVEPNHESPRWLKISFWAGMALGLAAVVLIWW